MRYIYCLHCKFSINFIWFQVPKFWNLCFICFTLYHSLQLSLWCISSWFKWFLDHLNFSYKSLRELFHFLWNINLDSIIELFKLILNIFDQVWVLYNQICMSVIRISKSLNVYIVKFKLMLDFFNWWFLSFCQYDLIKSQYHLPCLLQPLFTLNHLCLKLS